MNQGGRLKYIFLLQTRIQRDEFEINLLQLIVTLFDFLLCKRQVIVFSSTGGGGSRVA